MAAMTSLVWVPSNRFATGGGAGRVVCGAVSAGTVVALGSPTPGMVVSTSGSVVPVRSGIVTGGMVTCGMVMSGMVMSGIVTFNVLSVSSALSSASRVISHPATLRPTTTTSVMMTRAVRPPLPPPPEGGGVDGIQLVLAPNGEVGPPGGGP